MNLLFLASAAKLASSGTDVFPYVASLVHGSSSGPTNNTTFVESANNYTIAVTGVPSQGTFTPYGSCWSNYFNGSSYMNFASSSNLSLGSNDFTIEAWVYFSALPASGANMQFIQKGATSNSTMEYALTISNTSGTYSLNFTSGTTGANVVSATWSVVLGTWYHVAATRSSGTLTLWINGQNKASSSVSALYTGTGGVAVGANLGGTYIMDGYISNLRLVNGTAVYKSTFTPPTAPLAAITNTSLLCCNSNNFNDTSSNKFVPTLTGAPVVERFNPFGNAGVQYSNSVYGGSAIFNGSSQYIAHSGANSDTAFAGTFTVEGWIYPLAFATTAHSNCLVYNYGGGTAATNSFIFEVLSTGLLNYTYSIGSTGGVIKAGTTAKVLLNQWNHIAITRDSSNVIRLFVNGVMDSTTATVSGTFNTNGASLLVGAGNSTGTATPDGYFNGYISDLRMVNGTALYTAAYTPPTAPLTKITNTNFLLNFQNAGVIDSSMNNNLVATGSPTTSSTETLFGSATSLEVSAATTYYSYSGYKPCIGIPANSPFTVEAWIFVPAFSTSPYVVYENTMTTTTGTVQYTFCIDNGEIVANTSLKGMSMAQGVVGTWQGRYTTGVLPTANQWNHVAWTRDAAGNLRMFLNGVLQSYTTWTSGSGTMSQTVALQNSSSAPPGIGRESVANPWYMQDFRILNGYCAYTANFTPPTTAFPNQ